MIKIDERFFSPELRQLADGSASHALAALRALQDKSCVGSAWLGWYDWPRQKGRALAAAVAEYRRRIDVFYDCVVVIGIGGSYLGTRAIADALGHGFGATLSETRAGERLPIVYAGHHLSEVGLVELLDFLETRNPLINVISKSGTTTEPAVAFRVLRSALERRYGEAEAARRIVATTDASKGALRKLATRSHFECFEVPDDVGGRYSVLTAVGVLPLALAGYDVQALLDGADGIFRQLESADAAHPALRYAALRHAAWTTGKRVDVLASMEPKLATLCEWWKQLFGESEGKDGKGLFPASVQYTTDLHSLGQYLQDGARTMIETFLSVETPPTSAGGIERRIRIPAGDGIDELAYLEGRSLDEINHAAMLATMAAHADGGVPALGLSLARFDEAGLGALMATWEVSCAISAALLGVNPFDQPGVEAYKKNLFGLLGKPGFEELGAKLRKRL